MINKFTLLRNVGQFDSVQSGAAIPLTRLTLVYAENGRGKTTLAAILRSLSNGDPLPIQERKRLGTQNDPHVVLDCDGIPANTVFQNSIWNRTIAELAIFDDQFVTDNIFSGLAVDAGHRQNLHELIIGAQGVQLNATLQTHVNAIEQHNTRLREKGAAIPPAVRSGYSVDQFCALKARPKIEDEIQAAERNLAAARQQEPIRQAANFPTVSLPHFDVDELRAVLMRSLDDLESEAAKRVQEHISGLTQGGESWISEGMGMLADDPERNTCPFCAQPTDGSTVIEHYRAYFSEGYHKLKEDIETLKREVERTHGGTVQTTFERNVRTLAERRNFWKEFTALPELVLDSGAVVGAWVAVRDAILELIATKAAAPLESIDVSPEVDDLILDYNKKIAEIDGVNLAFQTANAEVALVKEQAESGNVPSLVSDLANLKAIKSRFEPEIAALCADYAAEQAAKTATETLRDQARNALDQYRTNIFPAYEAAINLYLQRFNAGYRLSSLSSQNTRAGSACVYNVVINNVPVAAATGSATPGQPAFRNTLSAGDRNTLALAFFFASLDQDPNQASRIAIIDDPMTSLDEHRTLTTAQEIRRLAGQINQVIVLSHSKPFLCEIWQGASTNIRSALVVSRLGASSDIQAWNVSADSETEYDRNHRTLREYVESGLGDVRQVAQLIRPVMEGYMRIARPEHFKAGSLLGPFLNNFVKPKIGAADEVYPQALSQELESLLEYGNRFHHDTNPNWMTAAINNGELLDFTRRTLAFTRR